MGRTHESAVGEVVETFASILKSKLTQKAHPLTFYAYRADLQEQMNSLSRE